MSKKERFVHIGDQYRNNPRYVLPKINIGDTVAVKTNAKLVWFSSDARKAVLGRTGKVTHKGKYHYTVDINGKEYHFQRLDLQTVV